MVDSTTVTLLATTIQTVVLTLTLLVFIFQFRSQEKAIREASYQNLLGRYNSFMMSGAESDDLLLSRLMDPQVELSQKETTAVRRLLLSYGIIEEAYELHKKGWMDDAAWEQWDSWLKALVKHPLFQRLHSSTQGMYDREYQDHITGLIGDGGGPA